MLRKSVFYSCISVYCLAGLASAHSPLSVIPTSPSPGDAVLIRLAITGQESLESYPLTVNEISTPWDFCPRSEKKALCAFIGIPLDETPGAITVRAGEHSLVVPISKKEFPKSNLRVAPKHAVFSPEDAKRIEEEQKILNQVFLEGSKQFLWKKPFQLPCKGKSTSPFGVQRVFNGERKSVHYGLDLRANEKTEVRSANSGRAAFVGNLFNGGNYVAIDHGGGVFTTYSHLSSIVVKTGDKIEIAQKIGMAGNTGRVTGPHLHWAVRLRDLYVDPTSFINLTR